MNKRIRACLVAMVLAPLCAGEAKAITVAASCETFSSSSGRRAFYVDPVKGNMSNDGSEARPWSTLADVLDNKRKLVATQTYSENYEKSDQKLRDKNPSAPIKPGDIIYLNNGDHGNVQIIGAVNKEFITVRATPGQNPTLRSLRVYGASKWIFIGLKIQGAGDGSSNSLSGSALIEFGRNFWLGPTSNIVLAESSISTVDDTNSWTDLDWVKKPFKFGVLSGATCVAITGNHFFNLRDALQFDGEHHFVADNKFDNFGNDAIDVIASNATIQNNKITDGRHTKSEPLHPDGIQGWSKPGATNVNVLIDGNIIIKTGDPKTTEMQGIGIFDGKWDGLTISNNVVITNHWHGISVAGATNTKIINNTVVAYDPVTRPTWITVYNPKDRPPSQNVIIRNNITTRLVFPETGVSVDHNIVAQRIDTVISGKPIYISKAGRYGDNNTINPEIYNSLVKIDHSKNAYDLRLKANSPAIGRGNPDQAPANDISGKKRMAPVDVGAYSR